MSALERKTLILNILEQIGSINRCTNKDMKILQYILYIKTLYKKQYNTDYAL